MKVFYALTFEEQSKSLLGQVRDKVKADFSKGRYTETDNFHMTLTFIGEVSYEEVGVLEEILYQLFEPSPDEWDEEVTQISPGELIPECLQLSHYGTFSNHGKDVLWVGVEDDTKLIKLQRELTGLVVDEGFEIADEAFVPHITLGRGIENSEALKLTQDMKKDITIRSLALMESKMIDGQTVYQVIDEVLIDEEA